MRAIHQLVAGFSHNDAISNEALVLRGIIRSWGLASDIFCAARRILPELRAEARPLDEARSALSPDDAVLLHLSIGSPANDLFADLACRKAILYHNISPPDSFRAFHPHIADQLAEGRAQAAGLAGAATVVMADSAFNAGELTEMGYRDVKVLPLVLDLRALGGQPDQAYLDELRDGKVNVLFVGRCVPNKRLEDLVRAFAYFQHGMEPQSRLLHVGSHAGTELYEALVRVRIREHRLEHVELAGALSQARLNACYRAADLFLCMSEHEGFCIPLIESMYHDVPILAYAAAAVPETLDGAGVLFKEKRYDQIAEMMGKLVHDTTLREAVIRGQQRRLQAYKERDLAAELRGHLAPLMEA